MVGKRRVRQHGISILASSQVDIAQRYRPLNHILTGRGWIPVLEEWKIT